MKTKKTSGTTRKRNAPAPWNVRGVTEESRSAARLAARREGVTIGAWLDRAIRDAANDQLRGPKVPAEPQADVLARLADTIERQNAHLASLEARRARSWWFKLLNPA